MWIVEGVSICTAHNSNTPLPFEGGSAFRVRLNLLRPAMRVIINFNDQLQRRQ